MAELLLKGGKVADGEKATLRNADVLISDGKIVAVGEGISAPDVPVVDCTGLVVTAGFVDAHVHIESGMVLPDEFGKAVLPHGTTAVIADPHEIVNVAGAKGLREFLEDLHDAPIDIFAVVPSCVPATPLDTNGAGKFLAEDMKEFVGRKEVVGLGEVMSFYDVVDGDAEMMDKLALFAGMTIDGHTSGMPDELLDAYVAAGISDDHECTDAHSLYERYKRGMRVYIREGSAAHNARDLLVAVRDMKLDTRRFAFCTDDKHLGAVKKEGHISRIAQIAREEGFDWGDIARMASYNPCRLYGLEKRGNVKEGYIADIAVISDDAKRVAYVIKNGEKVAENAKLCDEVSKRTVKRRVFENTVKFKEFTEKDFAVPERLKNIALELVDGQLVTLKSALADGEWQSLDMLATAERFGKNGNLSVCVLKNYGIKGGAVATSVSHDSHNAVCAGDNALDMAVALNRLKELGGGYVVASGGKVADELPLPAYGLMSVTDAESTEEAIARLEKLAHSMGVNEKVDVFTTLSFVALPVIPFIRLMDTGLYDTQERKFL